VETLKKENPYVKGRIPIVAFCSPSPAHKEYPNRIVKRSYEFLKELGVDILLGHDESIGTDESKNEYVFKAMDYCLECGMQYLARFDIMLEFVSIENCTRSKFKPFKLLSEQEKNDLKDRFLSQLEKYMTHKACIGIAFFDEPGTEMFEGISFARAVFKEKYPDKIFYVNHVSCLSTDRIYYYGQHGNGVADSYSKTPEFPSISYENRFRRYEKFVDYYYDTMGDDDVFSYDCYSIQDLGGLTNSINKSLYDMPYCAYVNTAKRNRSYWNFIQLSRFGCLTRMPNYNELALQISASLAIGSSGIELFPTCYPIDFLYADIDFAGSPIDMYGNKTEIFEMTKKALANTKVVREKLGKSKYLGVKAFGNFIDLEKIGLSKEQVENLQDGEAIFNGSFDWTLLPENCSEILVDCTSQVLVGFFKNGIEKSYLVVNNSLAYENNLKITFSKMCEVEIVRGLNVSLEKNKIINIDNLPAGECVLITIKES